MFVKMLDGRFAGEIKDLRPDVALEFIRQKRAERAFNDAAAPFVASQPFRLTDDPAPRGPRAAKKRSR